MKAVTVEPGTAGSARLEQVPEPDAALGSVVVEALAVGICGTDAELMSTNLSTEQEQKLREAFEDED